MKRKILIALGVLLSAWILFTASALKWGPWWEPYYGEVGSRWRYPDKNPAALAKFVAASIQHLQERGMVRCAPPPELATAQYGTGSPKGEVEAVSIWFKCPGFSGYYRLDQYSDPLYECVLSVVKRAPRPPQGASVTMVALVSPPELVEWDKWAEGQGARTMEEMQR